jgi:hypothetical protein
VKKLIVLLVIEFVAAYFFVMAGCPLRMAETRAWAAWYDHPTPETRAEFDRQKHITELEALGVSTVIFCGMAGVTLLIARAWRQKHKNLRDENHVV